MTTTASPSSKVYPSTPSRRVAFIGLGVMGYPMAGHLQRAGHQVCVYNRTPSRSAKWLSVYGGQSAATPRAAVAQAEWVFTCVGNDDDLRSVVLGEEGAFAGMKSGAILIDHTTASAVVARELAGSAENKGLAFLDAPLSGGQSGAENGILSIMCGGKPKDFEASLPILQSYGRTIALIGDHGSGQLAKMVNQICIAGLVQALAEGINFGREAGLDMNKVLEVITKGAAGSWQMENRGPTMLREEFNFGFAVDWMRKDLGLCLAEARRNRASLPVVALVDQFYADLQAAGDGRQDTSSLIKRLIPKTKKK